MDRCNAARAVTRIQRRVLPLLTDLPSPANNVCPLMLKVDWTTYYILSKTMEMLIQMPGESTAWRGMNKFWGIRISCAFCRQLKEILIIIQLLFFTLVSFGGLSNIPTFNVIFIQVLGLCFQSVFIWSWVCFASWFVSAHNRPWLQTEINRNNYVF